MNDQPAAVQPGYDRWAAVYDHDANPLQALEQPVVREWAGEVGGLRTLDLGCGTGRHTLWLAAEGADVTAVDFSDGMLAEARKKPGADGVRFVQHNLHEPLPFADGAFDLVVNGLVLEHLDDLTAFFAEVRRVLKPTGHAVVSAMHPAMFRLGSTARFTDPDSGDVVNVHSRDRSLSQIVMSVVRSGLRFENLAEFSPDEAFASRYPRAEKYIGYPMLVVMRLAA